MQNLTISQNIDLLAQYHQIRQTSVDLCRPLKTEDYVVQPVEFVSPPKWNLAHVTWFFETFILKPFKKNYQEYNPDYAFFFNSYYESLGKRTFRAHRGNMTRPTTEDVYLYRQYVDDAMQTLLQSETAIEDRFLQVFALGLNHEQQHQELLLTDLKYVLAHNPLFPPYLEKNDKEPTHFQNKSMDYIPIQNGLYHIGYQGNGFYFDNEKGLHQVYLHDFQFADRLVNNGEYLEFMQAGAYTQFQHWLGAGWEWVKANQIEAPLYWHCLDGEWYHYTLFGLQKVNLQEPVTHISFYEADAYARWAGKRLLTEFEWEIACKVHHPSIPKEANFLESSELMPQPSENHLQMYGDTWEWTNSAYLPYPFYKQDSGALGEYNGKFMINQMVLRGGSCVTPLSHIRPTYRNFFHPHERWQFTGIRLGAYL